MKKKLNAAFVGVGAFLGKHHLPNAFNNPIFNVHTLCRRNLDRLKKYSDRYKPEKVTADYKTILKDKDVDVVVIALQPKMHPKLCVEFLEAGKHVYVEKPLAETVEESLMVEKAARKSGKHLAVGFNRRFAPAYLDVVDAIKNDKGPIIVTYRMFNDYRDTPNWYRTRPRIIDENCHIMDIFNFITGSDPVSIYATEFGRKDDNIITVEFKNGATCVLSCSNFGAFQWPKERMEVVADNKVIGVEDFIELQAANVPGLVSKKYAGREYDGFSRGYAKAYKEAGISFYRGMRRMAGDLMYKSGLVDGDPDRDKWELLTEKYPEQIRIPIDYSCDKGWYNALDHFGKCIMEGKTPRNCDAQGGAKTVAMAEAALESIKKRVPVKIDKRIWEV